MNELQELFLEELADVHHAEHQLLKALPKMAKAASSAELKQAFQSHLEETETHVERIEQVFAEFDKPAKSQKCEAMAGLLEEGAEMLRDWKGSPAIDAALICAAQKAEHYEIASYGCLRAWAELLDNPKARDLLQETLEEEKAADDKLTSIAQSFSNEEAEQEGDAKGPRLSLTDSARRGDSNRKGSLAERVKKGGRRTMKIWGLIFCLGALPVVGGLTGCAGNSHERSTGEHIDDRATSSRVKKALGDDPQYKYEHVNVSTFKGTVQLSGFVNTRDQKNKAGDIAKKVEGVREIQNNITVKE
jgi:ferritin-like metal-binding protein YciE